MKTILSSVALFLSFIVPSMAQPQGTAMRSTNGYAFGTTTIGNKIAATNTASGYYGNGLGLSNAVDMISGNCIVVTPTNNNRGFIISVGNPNTNYIFWYTNTAASGSAFSPYKLTADGSGLTNLPSSSVTAPGSTTQVIFNNAGAFGADAGLTYDSSGDFLSTLGVPILKVQNGIRNYFLAGAGNLTASGNSSLGIGYLALANLTSGSANTVAGQQSGTQISSGFWNTYLGGAAGYLNATGFNNVAIGVNAQLNNLKYDNVSIGVYSMFKNTNGYGNVAIGTEAMYGNIGDNQIINGSFADATRWTFGTGWAAGVAKADKSSDGTGTLTTLPANYIDYGVGATYRIVYTVADYTVGSVTASFGGVSDTARSANGTYTWDAVPTSYPTNGGTLTFTPTSTSRFSLTGITLTATDDNSATYNVASGVGALYMATTALENVAEGAGAMRQATKASYNVAIGSGALGQNGPGNTNVALGRQAFYTGDSISGGVAIGNEAGYWETLNGRFYLDNTRRTDLTIARNSSLLYGVFDSNQANQTFQINAGFAIVNTGTGRFGGMYLNQFSADGYYPILRLQSSRNNTLGTMTTTINNAILGAVRMSGVNTSLAHADSAGMFTTQVGTSGATYVPGSLSLYTSTDSGQNLTHLVLETGGDVGIGISTPAAKLDVVGDIRASTTITATNGFVGFATNFIANGTFTDGFTNSTAFGAGTNAMVVNIGATSGTLEFYNRSGLNGQTVCGVGCFTNILTATSVDYSVGVNQGFVIRSPVGTVIVARSFP